MNKNYISIMELFPTLIEDAKSDNPKTFASPSRLHFFLVDHTETLNNTLTFASMPQTFMSLSTDVPSYMRHRLDGSDQSQSAPFIYDLPYEMPCILEFEYLKRSYYGDHIPEDVMVFIERMMYHYVLMYERIMSPFEYSRNIERYTDNSAQGDFFQRIEDRIHTIDIDTDDGVKAMEEIIDTAYETLQKEKQISSKARRHMAGKAPVEKTFSTAIQYFDGLYYSTTTDLAEIVLLMPLLMLLSELERKNTDSPMGVYATYKDHIRRMNMRTHLRSSLPSQDETSVSFQETDTALFSGGNHFSGLNGLGINLLDDEVVKFVLPHILNVHRLSLFGEHVAISSEDHREFLSEPWAEYCTPSLILNASTLSWEVEDDE